MADPKSPQTLLRIALAENARLLEENARLKKLLASQTRLVSPTPANASFSYDSISIDKPRPVSSGEDRKGNEEQKITLFRKLFRGREDVYAIRWESRDRSKSGYAPASLQDWDALARCGPTERSRVNRQTRRLLPLTDEAFRQHLKGKQTIGIYPLLPDDTCWFVAVDFDKKSWQEDSLEFLQTCRRLSVPAYLERSRSGNGAHVWIFFDEPVAASVARRLGCSILTRTMERRPQLGLDSYDRLFPNQDTLPKGGFGNLIAAPLQWTARLKGNSVFINDDFRPFDDQWAFLSAVTRMHPSEVDRIVHDAWKQGDVIGVRMSVAADPDDGEPWNLPPSKRLREPPVAGPFPKSIDVVISNLIYIPKRDLPAAMVNRLIRLAAFQNPEFYRAQAMRLSTYGKPRVISCSEDLPEYVALPRGSFDEATALLEKHGIRIGVKDERFVGQPIQVSFSGALRGFQIEAFEKVICADIGVVSAPTAFGKTVLAARIIAERKVNTLVLVHRHQLLDQWRERLAVYLDLPSDGIGYVGGGKEKRTKVIDVASIQSLQRKGVVKDLVADYGQVIVDECHHLSAFSFEQVMRQVKARYVLGLTATPVRKDGHQPIIHMQCGPIIYALHPKKAMESSPFEHKVLPRSTDFQAPSETESPTIQELYAAIATDQPRNALIADDIVAAANSGRTPLVLSGRTEHLKCLQLALTGRIKNLFVLRGGMGKKQRAKAAGEISAVPLHEPRVILATGSYIGEGFDDPRLDTLFLAAPISWRGTLQQYVGRLHRLHEGKRVVQVYDYVDGRVAMLGRMFKKRLKGYAAIGYSIENTKDVTNSANLFDGDRL